MLRFKESLTELLLYHIKDDGQKLIRKQYYKEL